CGRRARLCHLSRSWRRRHRRLAPRRLPRTQRPHPLIERWPQAVIFDMDGLMLDTEAPALRAWESAARALGREFDLELCRQMIGSDFGDCVALIRERHGPDYPVE